MDKKFWISGIAASVIAFFGGFVVHGMLLHDDYLKVQHLFRTEADHANYWPYMIIAHLLIGFSFAWIYSQGIAAGRPWLVQGLRYGIAVAFVSVIPMYLIYYSVQPLPGMTVVKQIVFMTLVVVLNGIVVAFINKSTDAAAAV